MPRHGTYSSTQGDFVMTKARKMTKSNVEEYKNAATKILSNFMKKDSMSAADPLADIDFDGAKIPSTTTLETLAAALDYELSEKEWFVTGKVNPRYFSKEFEFQDPDVQLKGIEEYARGVRRLFDQQTSRAQIISTVVNPSASTPEAPVITCTWRLSGNVNIAFGLPIKPYIVYTDFTVDPESSLIIYQQDRFSLPQWDILLRCVIAWGPPQPIVESIEYCFLLLFCYLPLHRSSALFPALIGKVTAQPAPPVEQRKLEMPKFGVTTVPLPIFQPFDALAKFFDRKGRAW
jgi:hypothetical protein